MKTAIQKLHPQRFPNMSTQMIAIVGHILGEVYTDPSINDMCVTSDGFVLAQHEGDVGMNEFIGGFSDLQRNWENLLNCAGLSKKERQWAEQQFQNNITIT